MNIYNINKKINFFINNIYICINHDHLDSHLYFLIKNNLVLSLRQTKQYFLLFGFFTNNFKNLLFSIIFQIIFILNFS